MKLSAEQRSAIVSQYATVGSVEQLAALLQTVYESKFPYRNRRSPVIIQTRDLTYQAFANQSRYNSFSIPKKSGGTRSIMAPAYKLKTIQKCINEVLLSLFTPHRSAYGFVLGKSVADNAKVHVAKNFVYNVDLKDFFPSISFRRVKTVLELPPFNLKDEKEPLGFLIANLCCHEGCLPQGAPTSPTLSNIICQRLDRKLEKLAKSHNAYYTRYADDISFSSRLDVFDDRFRVKLKRIIQKEENFELNFAKERKQDWRVRQEVTGLVVNQKTNVPKEYIKDIRYWLRTWEKFGFEKTQKDFLQRYRLKKGFHRNSSYLPFFYAYLLGKINYLRMVRGKDDVLYVRFNAAYKALLESSMPKLDLKKDYLGKPYLSHYDLDYAAWSNEYLALQAKIQSASLAIVEEEVEEDEEDQALYMSPVSRESQSYLLLLELL